MNWKVRVNNFWFRIQHAKAHDFLRIIHEERRTTQFEFELTIYILCRTDIDRLIDQILLEEPLISESRKPQLKKLIEKLIEKQQENQD